MRVWPSSLFGRLVLILVTGMLAAQILTSSIWYDVRHSQVLEIPTRLIATRLANIVRLSHLDPRQADSLIGLIDSPNFHLTLSEHPSTVPGSLSEKDLGTERLLNKVLSEKTGYSQTLRLLQLSVVDQQGQVAGLSTLFGTRPAIGRFLIDLRLPDGRWLLVEASEEQGWTSTSPLDLLFDYVMRIYLLRIIVVVMLALLAVRLAIRPLNALAKAAEALGRDIRRPPLPLDGPTEVRRAAQAFNVMQQQLIASIAERTRFLAAISHDLRSPITRLRLRTEMLEDNQVKERFRTDLEDMEHMVSSTLDFVSSGEVNEERQQIDINALLRSLQADLQDIGEPILVEGSAQRPMPGYARSLKRCVQNLLENAVRYGREVVVRIEDQPQQLRIVISDRGPGVPEALLEQVVEPFYRIEGSRNAKTGGYGLGLSIAHTIAAAHGGRMTLRNREGGGLEVTLAFERRED
ncbi:ATP-binding protein [Pseudomonas vanderleydeniana]|uniref:histidine kinase n=1 Tax=Pseudomonas vanderleydeniana TaxID=2745495 RepID=A0A9E6PJT8_9PSED|nr:ATP-binding protein [Pseudomonas vanderleydeniana]QXI27458.1 HAMP domain-containing protein [Pseudomonas vanderleydeniana]